MEEKKYNNILFRTDGEIGIISLNRPEVLNALNIATLNELESLINELEHELEINVLIITGEGHSFIAGGDLGEMSKMEPEQGYDFVKYGQHVLSKIENFPVPVIAAINGFALGGGCELALACDIRWASERATFAQPEVKLGIIPGFGGTQRLAKICGPGIAKELILSGNTITAKEALDVKLITKIIDHENLMNEVLIFAKKICEGSAFAISQAKQSINSVFNSKIADGFDVEAILYKNCIESGDSKEGMNSFLEKRKPIWRT